MSHLLPTWKWSSHFRTS